MKDAGGKEETEFDKRSKEIDKAHKDMKTPPGPEEMGKIVQDMMDSIDIIVPLQVSISLENVSSSSHPEIKLIELSSKKQIEYERLTIGLETKSVEQLQAIKDDQTFEAMVDFEKAELEDLYKMTMLICDNGLNQDKDGKCFVSRDFCENVLSKTLIYKILITYMKKFTSQALIERMKLINFLAMPVMLSDQRRQKNFGGTG